MSGHAHKQSVADAGYLFSSDQDNFFSQLSEENEPQQQAQPSSSYINDVFGVEGEQQNDAYGHVASPVNSSAHHTPSSSYQPQLHHKTYAQENPSYASPAFQNDTPVNSMYNVGQTYTQPLAPQYGDIYGVNQPHQPPVPNAYVDHDQRSQVYSSPPPQNANVASTAVINDPYNPAHSARTTPDINQSLQSLSLGPSPPPPPPLPALKKQRSIMDNLNPYAAPLSSEEPQVDQPGYNNSDAQQNDVISSSWQPSAQDSQLDPKAATEMHYQQNNSLENINQQVFPSTSPNIGYGYDQAAERDGVAVEESVHALSKSTYSSEVASSNGPISRSDSYDYYQSSIYNTSQSTSYDPASYNPSPSPDAKSAVPLSYEHSVYESKESAVYESTPVITQEPASYDASASASAYEPTAQDSTVYAPPSMHDSVYETASVKQIDDSPSAEQVYGTNYRTSQENTHESVNGGTYAYDHYQYNDYHQNGHNYGPSVEQQQQDYSAYSSVRDINSTPSQSSGHSSRNSGENVYSQYQASLSPPDRMPSRASASAETSRPRTVTPYASQPSCERRCGHFAKFGFGGQLITFIPPRSSSASPFNVGTDDSAQSQANSPCITIRPLSTLLPFNPSHCLPGSNILNLPSPTSFDTTKKNKKKDHEEILKWLDSQLLTDAFSSPAVEKPVLLNLVSTLVKSLDSSPQKKGPLSRRDLTESLLDCLHKETSCVDLGKPTHPSSAELLSSDTSFSSDMQWSSGVDTSENSPSSILRMNHVSQSFFDKFHHYLAKGERQEALKLALDDGQFAHALLIASTIDSKAWQEVVNEIISVELRGGPTQHKETAANRDLRIYYKLLSGQVHAVADELVGPRSLSSDVLSTHSQESPKMMDGSSWESTLAVLLANSTKDCNVDAQVFNSLAESFSQTHYNPEAAQVSILFSYLTLHFGRSSPNAVWPPQNNKTPGKFTQESLPIFLLTPLPQLQSLSSVKVQDVCLVQVLEYLNWLLQSSVAPANKNRNATSNRLNNNNKSECLPLTVDSPDLCYYYFLLANFLTEYGRWNDAQRLCEIIGSSLTKWMELQKQVTSTGTSSGKSTPFQPPPTQKPSFQVSSLMYMNNKLLQRLSVIVSSPGANRSGKNGVPNSSSWGMLTGKVPMQRPTLDNIWSSLEGKITKFVAGEDEGNQAAAAPANTSANDLSNQASYSFQPGHPGTIREAVSMSNLNTRTLSSTPGPHDNQNGPVGPFTTYSSITSTSSSPSQSSVAMPSDIPYNEHPPPLQYNGAQQMHMDTTNDTTITRRGPHHSHQRSVSLGNEAIDTLQFGQQYRSVSAAPIQGPNYGPSSQSVPTTTSGYDDPYANYMDGNPYGGNGNNYGLSDDYNIYENSTNSTYGTVAGTSAEEELPNGAKFNSEDSGSSYDGGGGWWSNTYQTGSDPVSEMGQVPTGRDRSDTIRPPQRSQSEHTADSQFISSMEMPSVNYYANLAQSSQSQQSYSNGMNSQPSYQPPAEEFDDLGFGNKSYAKKSLDETSRPSNAMHDNNYQPARKSTDDAKRPQLNPEKSTSWLSRLFKRDNTSSPTGPVKVHLGESSSAVYYDHDLKRWVNKNAGSDTSSAEVPPPPPMRAQTASPTSSGRSINNNRQPMSSWASTPPPMSSTTGGVHGPSRLASETFNASNLPPPASPAPPPSSTSVTSSRPPMAESAPPIPRPPSSVTSRPTSALSGQSSNPTSGRRARRPRYVDEMSIPSR